MTEGWQARDVIYDINKMISENKKNDFIKQSSEVFINSVLR
jgi:hypothetical protein